MGNIRLMFSAKPPEVVEGHKLYDHIIQLTRDRTTLKKMRNITYSI